MCCVWTDSGPSVNALALALGVPATRIHEIVKERRSVTADTAQRLAQYFGGKAGSWLVLQAHNTTRRLKVCRKLLVALG